MHSIGKKKAFKSLIDICSAAWVDFCLPIWLPYGYMLQIFGYWFIMFWGFKISFDLIFLRNSIFFQDYFACLFWPYFYTYLATYLRCFHVLRFHLIWSFKGILSFLKIVSLVCLAIFYTYLATYLRCFHDFDLTFIFVTQSPCELCFHFPCVFATCLSALQRSQR